LKQYTALFPFCGIGGGALGFKESSAKLFGKEAAFKIIGGIDFDAPSCRDFTYLTGAPALCADIAKLTPPELLAFCERCPDVVFMSPPCKGASGLLSAAKAKTAKYRAMNRLALRWLELMLATWKERPKLILFENVPRLKQRAAGMLRRVRRLLKGAGYVFTDGFHDCGELGGLAQVRRRYLLVARDPKQVPTLLYQPPKLRVRGCGEVLGELPLPNDPAGGPMHRLPKLSWLNWVRLALIPAGGDWRDLDDVLRTGQPRREVFRRHHVSKWGNPSVTIAGAGSNGPSAVADPRPKEWFGNVLRVKEWQEPGATVTAGNGVTNGGGAVADPRVKPFGNVDRVTPWDEAMGTVTTSPAPSSGAGAVADPRIGLAACGEGAHHNVYRVEGWTEPAHTVTGATRPGGGAPSVADARFSDGLDMLQVKKAYDHGYGVLREGEPSSTVAGGSMPGQGAYAVADGRYRGTYGVLTWEEAVPTVTGNARPPTGTFSVADVRFKCEMRSGTYGVMSWQAAAATIRACHTVDTAPAAVADPRFPSPKKPPTELQIIISADGTWHRPLTTYELAALQSLPLIVNGEPLKLDGEHSGAWRERIGNAVPRKAAAAMGTQMLVCLLQADLGGFSLASESTPVWISPPEARADV
jgi:site-specific DNA-cytosine methylase